MVLNQKYSEAIKYFNTIEAWKIESVNASAQPQQSQPVMQSAPTPDISTFSAADESDDLPF